MLENTVLPVLIFGAGRFIIRPLSLPTVSASLLLELGQVESAQQCLGRAIFLQPEQAGLRIRIRPIRIPSGQWIRIQEGKNDEQK
jgi:hypothetical protein